MVFSAGRQTDRQTGGSAPSPSNAISSYPIAIMQNVSALVSGWPPHLLFSIPSFRDHELSPALRASRTEQTPDFSQGQKQTHATSISEAESGT